MSSYRLYSIAKVCLVLFKPALELVLVIRISLEKLFQTKQSKLEAVEKKLFSRGLCAKIWEALMKVKKYQFSREWSQRIFSNLFENGTNRQREA